MKRPSTQSHFARMSANHSYKERTL